jgi:adenosylcobinamide-GDP ribazoletransferase
MAGAAMAWAPGVGLLLGVVAAGLLVAAGHPLGAGPLAGAVLAIAALAFLTRGLHLDGLADLADGLGSGKPADQALAIMRKSDIGPLGVVTLVLAVLVQVAALARAETLSAVRGAAAAVIAVTAARLAMTWACRTGVPAARPGGLGAMVAGSVRMRVPAAETAVALAAVIAGVLIWPEIGWTPPVALLAGLAVAYGLERHAVRRLGGITGDVLGALAEVAATVVLLVACMGPPAA